MALCLAILACVDVQAATQSMPTEIDLAQVPSDVRKEAETKAQKLCGWSAETLAKVQEDVAANETAAASPGKAKEKPKTRRLLVGGKVGGGAAQAKPAAGAGTGVPNDPDALAKLLCAELDVAKKLDAVGADNCPHFGERLARPWSRRRQFLSSAELRSCRSMST